MSNGPHRSVTLIDEQGRVSAITPAEAHALEAGGPQTRVEPMGRAHPNDRLRASTRLPKHPQGMVFETSTVEGKAALEEFKRTGKAPKHPGVAALEAQAATRAALPFPGMQVIYGPAPDPSVPLFSAEDAEQAVRIYHATVDGDVDGSLRVPAMLEVMMFALKLAAINLDVHPE